MNWVDILILAAVAAAAGFAIWLIRRNRKKGCSCCGDARSCSGSCGTCGKKKQ